jgi:hypothetical protein
MELAGGPLEVDALESFLASRKARALPPAGRITRRDSPG